MPLGFANLTWGTNLGRAGLGSSGVAGSPAFSLSDLQNDSNVVLVQDPSAIWGGADMLERRNLLTYTEDFSNAAWAKSEVTATSTGFLETTATSIHQMSGYNPATAIKAGRLITLRVRIQGVGRDWAFVGLASGPAGATAGYRRYVNLNTGEFGAGGGTYGAVSNASASASVSPSGGVDVIITCSFDASNATGSAVIYGATAAGTVTYTGDITKGLNISNCGIYVSSTIDQSYKKVTDWTTELYQHAATKNVPWLRRNMASFTADLRTSAEGATGSPWSNPVPAGVGSIASAGGEFGNDCTRFSFTAADFCGRTISISATSGTTYTVSFKIKKESGGSGAGRLSSGLLGYVEFTPTESWQTVVMTKTAGSSGTAYLTIIPIYAAGKSGSYLIDAVSIQVGTTYNYQHVQTTWPATYAANAQAAGAQIVSYSDRAGTTATDYSDVVVGKLLDLSGDNNHAIAPSDAARPLLKKDANGYWYLLRDGVDDNLPITFQNLGANCVTYVCDGTQVVKTTGVTLNGAHNTTTPTNDYGRIYCASPPTAAREAQIIKYLKAKAGIA